MPLDMIKYTDVYKPQRLDAKTEIVVIGVGAVGSALALELAKLDVPNLVLLDHDKVVEHNISNQLLYGPEDVGTLKVHAASKRITELTGLKPLTINMEVIGQRLYPDVAVLTVDTMTARRRIFEMLVTNKKTRLMLDVRLTARQAQVIAIDLFNPTHVNGYRDGLYSDEDVKVETGGCNITPSIGATAHMATSLATWIFIDWVMDRPWPNEIIWQQHGYQMITTTF